LLHDARTALGGAQDHVHRLAAVGVGLVDAQFLGAAADPADDVLELVGDAAGQGAERGEAFGLGELAVRTAQLGEGAFEVLGLAGDLAFEVVALRLQGAARTLQFGLHLCEVGGQLADLAAGGRRHRGQQIASGDPLAGSAQCAGRAHDQPVQAEPQQAEREQECCGDQAAVHGAQFGGGGRHQALLFVGERPQPGVDVAFGAALHLGGQHGDVLALAVAAGAVLVLDGATDRGDVGQGLERQVAQRALAGLCPLVDQVDQHVVGGLGLLVGQFAQRGGVVAAQRVALHGQGTGGARCHVGEQQQRQQQRRGGQCQDQPGGQAEVEERPVGRRTFSGGHRRAPRRGSRRPGPAATAAARGRGGAPRRGRR
jgi:hypothetical protein